MKLTGAVPGVKPRGDGRRSPRLEPDRRGPDGRDGADDDQPDGRGPADPPARAAVVTGEHTLKIEAARAGVGVGEYQARLQHGLLWCYRCQDWHRAEAFPADARRHSGRAGSCHQAIRAAARDALARRAQVPPPEAVWVIRRPEPAPRLTPGGQPWTYWRGPSRGAIPGPDRAGAWSPALGTDVARFPGPRQACDALITAFGGASAVPPGCRLVRLA